MKRLLIALVPLVLASMLSAPAHAWWSADWPFRKKILINTSPTGADLKEAVGPIAVALRLHSGNFLFTDARTDGSDIRFVTNDDKTPLKYHVERFDSANQLAIIWVQLPQVSAGSSAEYFWMYSGNDKATASADDPKGIYDAAQLLALEFGEAQPPFRDTSPFGSAVAGEGVKADASGAFGGAAVFTGSPLTVTPAAGVQVAAGGPLTFSAWIRPEGPPKAKLLSWGPLSIELDGDRALVRIDKAVLSGGPVPQAAWTHVGVSLSDKATIYLNGAQVATGPLALPELKGQIVVGEGFNGAVDSLGLNSAARGAAWFRAVASMGSDGKLLSYGESEASEEAGSSYIKILFSSLTVDAKVVIAILGLMFVIAVFVMVNKAVQVSRTDSHNAEFLESFEEKPREYLDPNSRASREMGGGRLAHSSLVRLYETGMRELRLRLDRAEHQDLSAESVAAIKASIDSTLIRENQRLNRLMVLLTIAISGGPFLGLLGTVVGVMITFASIAAQGDVNINAIAPGIAAALLATVAGLAVAIPSLFGYNYLITRIKAITADMQAFSDEFICKMAEAQSR